MVIIIDKQDESIRRLDHIVYGLPLLLGIFFFATIFNIIHSNLIYSLISGILTIVLIRYTYSTLIHFSYPKLHLYEHKINILYYKFGIQIGAKSLRKKDIAKCYIIDNSNWILQGFSVILENKKDTIEIGIALMHDDAKSIERKIQIWLS